MARRKGLGWLKQNIESIILGERDIGYLDPGVDELLIKLNKISGLATTSTCTGRISIVEGKKPWERGLESARIVYKTHTMLRVEDLKRILSQPFCDLWLKVSAPIIHARTSSVECAFHMLSLAREHGFKHSGILSIKPDEGVMVELMGGSQIIHALRINCLDIHSPNTSTLETIVNMANIVLEENKIRFKSIIEALTSVPGPCSNSS